MTQVRVLDTHTVLSTGCTTTQGRLTGWSAWPMLRVLCLCTHSHGCPCCDCVLVFHVHVCFCTYVLCNMQPHGVGRVYDGSPFCLCLPVCLRLYLCSPTAWHGCEMGEVGPTKTVAIWGAGPVGILAAMCAFNRGAPRVVLIDNLPYRLEFAQSLMPKLEV